jgi:hypothetical protein
MAARSASAYVSSNTVGRIGAFAVADDANGAALRCTYDHGDLNQMTVAAPKIFGTARRKRLVGWQLQISRAEWWAKLPDIWYVAYSTPIVTATATRKVSATLGDQAWSVPREFETNYDSFKVELVLYWYSGTDQQIGTTTLELQYFGQETAGEPFDPTTSTLAGHCLGSQNAPQPPPVDPIAAVPAGFVKMSHWQPYWRKFTTDKVQATIDELTAMHQTGVVLTGIESGDKYALPPGVATYLQMFRDAGITPYMSLWIGKFSPAEMDTTVRAWNAGNGLWGGIVLDVEAGLLTTVARDGRTAADAALDKYMATVRPMTPFLAYSTMPVPTDFPDMLYPELNSYADVFMPQLYFRGGKSSLYLFDKLKAAIDYESPSWPEPPKPMLPVVDDWDPNLNVDELQSYIQIALSRYGAISAWRLHPEMQQAVKNLWGTFAD